MRRNPVASYAILSFTACIAAIAPTRSRADDCTAITSPQAARDLSQFDPRDPGSSGYKLTFADEFNSPSTIDIENTGGGSYKWYTAQFFGQPATPSNKGAVANGILTLFGSGAANAAIATARPANNAEGFIGTTFAGGAYFEARLSFDPRRVNVAHGWPSFWAMAIEHMAAKNASQWIGQDNGYEHFAEDDIFEYDTESIGGMSSYGGAIHDWYGRWNKTCPKVGYCDMNNAGKSTLNNYLIKVSPEVDWTQFHTFGQLWVAGENVNGHKGYVQYFFDGNPTSDVVTWIDEGPGSPPPAGASMFSVMDGSHLVLILGTGTDQPMKVDWVRVWQRPERSEPAVTLPSNVAGGKEPCATRPSSSQ